MITYSVNNFKLQSQSDYDDSLEELVICSLVCNGGHSGLIIHGYYGRNIMTESGLTEIVITRLKCHHCGKTHALLPASIVPYHHVLLADQLELIKEKMTTNRFLPFLDRFLDVDETEAARIYRRFLDHWHQRIVSAGMTVFDDRCDLVGKAFSQYRRQFLQTHCGVNCLAVNNHITSLG